jgi:hypothetical protein
MNSVVSALDEIVSIFARLTYLVYVTTNAAYLPEPEIR